MNKSVRLIAALVILAVLVAAWIVVNKMTSDKGGEPDETESDLIFTVRTDPAAITSMQYTSDGETYSFVFTDSEWRNPSDSHMPLDQKKLASAASALTTVACSRLISSDAAGSAEYGLDSPSHTVSLSFSDGTAVSYYIGGYNKHTDEYYFNVKGETAVYSVAKGITDYCSDTYSDLIAEDKMEEIDSESVTSITSRTKNGVITLTKGLREETVTDDSGTESKNTTVFYTLKNEAGAEEELDGEEGLKIVSALLSPAKLTLADYWLEDSEKASYGLDSPTEIIVSYDKVLEVTNESSSSSVSMKQPAEYTILIGAVTSPDGAIFYMQFGGSAMVFEIDASSVSALV